MGSRPDEVFDVRGDARTDLLAALTTLVADESGWVNVAPLLAREDLPPRHLITALFSAKGPLLPVATFVPGTRGRAGQVGPSSLGLQHPEGRKVAAVLRARGVTPPDGYRVVSDNPRRGLVLEAQGPGELAEVADWLLVATGAVCPSDFDGWWRAMVFRGSAS